jgi:hypothetical protein
MISGVVPEVLSASAEIFRDALAFKPQEQVRDRVIGKIRMKYNVPLSAIEISSNRADGVPANDVHGRYPFGPYGYSVKIGYCEGIASSGAGPIVFPSEERRSVSIGSARSLTAGVDTTCDLLGSWDGAEKESAESGMSYSVDYSISLSPAG